MLPHERSLVAKFKDKPFALIGMNSDSDLDFFHKQQKENGVTWRSFWNGPEGTSGPISKRWNVYSWPTLYYIDHTGVIRYKNVRDEQEMEKVLGEMIAAAEKGAKK